MRGILERASLLVIKRDLRRAGLPDGSRLVWRIARAQRAASSENPPIVNKIGLGLPDWVSPQTLRNMGSTERLISAEIKKTKITNIIKTLNSFREGDQALKTAARIIYDKDQLKAELLASFTDVVDYKDAAEAIGATNKDREWHNQEFSALIGSFCRIIIEPIVRQDPIEIHELIDRALIIPQLMYFATEHQNEKYHTLLDKLHNKIHELKDKLEKRGEFAEQISEANEEEILLDLSSEDPLIRRCALEQYIERGMHEPQVFPLVDAMIVDVLGAQRERIEEFRGVIEECDLPLSHALIGKIEEEGAIRETIGEKIREITQVIIGKISAALGIKPIYVAVSYENGINYASVGMGAAHIKSIYGQEHEILLPQNILVIETGETVEEMNERINILNFLVHHEVGHIFQLEKGIRRPTIRAFSLLDQKEVERNAYEIMIDKLAFEAARKIFVYGGDDIVSSENVRETITIDAYLAWRRIVLRNLKSGAHIFSDENQARIVAVLREMAISKNISAKTKSELAESVDVFRARIILGQSAEKIGEIDALIKAYREIFRQTRLD